MRDVRRNQVGGWSILRGRPVEEIVGVAVMVALVLITLANVLVRYFTNQSFAWTEEVSVFLLVVVTLAGAALACAQDAHIRIDFFYRRGSPARQRGLRMLSVLATTVLFALLALMMARAGWDEFDLGETTPGLGVPRWWYTVWMPLLALLVAVRAILGYRHRGADAEPADEGASS